NVVQRLEARVLAMPWGRKARFHSPLPVRPPIAAGLATPSGPHRLPIMDHGREWDLQRLTVNSRAGRRCAQGTDFSRPSAISAPSDRKRTIAVCADGVQLL